MGTIDYTSDFKIQDKNIYNFDRDTPDFKTVELFEQKIAEFFGSPYCIAVDCCTHGVELCLRYTKAYSINVPINTYLSIPLLANKLNISLHWRYDDWKEYYALTNLVYDAAVLWRKNSYLPGKFMCLSFQRQKHLNLIKGGAILVPDKESYDILKAMSYDGRPDLNKPWRSFDNIRIHGYHYYLEPEKAELGLKLLPEAIERKPREWSIKDWPDISKFSVFQEESEEISEDLILASCDQCGENAWDGYICHNCGLKKI